MDVQLQGRALTAITISQIEEFDKYGKPSKQTDAPLQAYVWGGQKRVIAFDGTEMISNKHYIVDGQFNIEDGDYIIEGDKKIPIKAFEVYYKLFTGNGTTVLHA